MKHEETARGNHRAGNNCAVSVYTAFADINTNPGSVPALRGDGGKCGELRKSKVPCNDLVGGAADIVDHLHPPSLCAVIVYIGVPTSIRFPS